jgi:uncharacterized protein with HEPN domain
MRSNKVFLQHIRDEIHFLLRETDRLTFAEFMSDEVLKRACTRSFEIIGEAAKNLTPEFRKRHKQIQWREIAGFRDRLIHQYFGIRWDVLWNVITAILPDLRRQVEDLLEEGSENKK